MRALDKRVLDTGRTSESEVTYAHEGATHTYYLKHLPLTNANGQIYAIGSVAVDITTHKQAQEAIQQQQTFRTILREREHLARTIDTTIGGILNQIHTQVQAVSESLPGDTLTPTHGILSDLRALIQDAQSRVQSLALGISSDEETDPTFATLYHQRGFFPALREYMRRSGERFHIRIETIIPPHLLHEHFPTSVQINLLSILQETLAAARHNGARHVWCAFALRDRMLHLTITDDGQRSTSSDATLASTRRITDQNDTLRRLHKRVRDIGGTLNVRTVPPDPAIDIQMPLRRQGDLRVQSIQVLIASHHPAAVQTLQTVLETHGLQVPSIAHNATEASERIRALRPDIVLLDADLPPHGAPEAIRQIKTHYPEMKAVVFTHTATDDELFAAIRSGAMGYVPTSLPADDLIDLLLGLQRGEIALLPPMAQKVLAAFAHTDETSSAAAASPETPDSLSSLLSPRQMEVLWLVAQDYTYREVGEILGFSERTIKHYMSGIIKQLQLQSRAEAVALVRQRMHQPPPDTP
jgi:two-component system NarL family response regulator